MKNIMILFLTILVFFLSSGCEISRPDEDNMSEEHRKKSIFWQFRQPKLQLDPIQQKEMPDVYVPVKEQKSGE